MPKSKSDPTGVARYRASANRKLTKRLAAAKRDVKNLFRSAPNTRKKEVVPNAKTTVYDYNDSFVLTLAPKVKAILDLSFLETRDDRPPFDWYWEQEVEKVSRHAVLEETNQFNALIAGAITAGFFTGKIPPVKMDPLPYLKSSDHLAILNTSILNNFNSITAISDKLSSEIFRAISDGMAAGNNPSSILSALDDRFAVAGSAAKRTVNTEINKAYNDAKIAAGAAMAAASGLDSVVRHISALLPTTRPPHAARHEKVYTVSQQTTWWNTGANRINCYCTTQTVLIDPDGNIVEEI